MKFLSIPTARGCGGNSENPHFQSKDKITVRRSLAGGRSAKNNRNFYDTPKPCLFFSISEEILSFGMFLTGGMLIIFLDSAHFLCTIFWSFYHRYKELRWDEARGSHGCHCLPFLKQNIMVTLPTALSTNNSERDKKCAPPPPPQLPPPPFQKPACALFCRGAGGGGDKRKRLWLAFQA